MRDIFKATAKGTGKGTIGCKLVAALRHKEIRSIKLESHCFWTLIIKQSVVVLGDITGSLTGSATWLTNNQAKMQID